MREEIIGDCTLYLGDCRDVLPTLGKVDAVVCDPPYGMAFQSNYRSVQYERLKHDDTRDALLSAFTIDAAHSRYIFCRWDDVSFMPQPRSLITWIKNNWSMGDLYHEHARQTECVLFYPGDGHFFPNGRPTDVIDARRTENVLHPTEKPVYLMLIIVGWTAGTVLDPYAGSGTTGVACVKLGRRFIGIEIEPRYFDIACRRIEAAVREPRLPLPEPRPKQQAML